MCFVCNLETCARLTRFWKVCRSVKSLPRFSPQLFFHEAFPEGKVCRDECARIRQIGTCFLRNLSKCFYLPNNRKKKVRNSGAALFFDPEMFFSRPRDWSILFSAAACLFFDLQLFFSPAMRPRKRAQSFFQPLCIILSSLFLGPKHLVANPGSFSNPETSFSGPPVFF